MTPFYIFTTTFLFAGLMLTSGCGDDSGTPSDAPPDTLPDTPDDTTVDAETTPDDTTADAETTPDDTTADSETTPDDTTADSETTPDDTTADSEVIPDTVSDTRDGDEVEVEPTPLEPLFTTRAVHAIDFTLPAADWEHLRHQQRSRIEMFAGDCQARPHESPFTYFAATLTIDGVTVSDVGLRKKGWLGSVEAARPSLKLKLDEYVPGQNLAGLDDLVLNNARQDRSLVRQCLGYALFAAAGVPSPRCGFAHVRVNDEDLGLYVLVEAVDGDFLETHFPNPDGNMYEGVFSDFRTGWLGSFEPETNKATADKSDLAAVAALLEATPPLADDDFVAALEALVDVDQLISYWAMESILVHRDGYASRGNNFHVYNDPANGFVFLPHGIDQILDGDLVAPGPATAAYADAALPRRMLAVPALRARYVARLRELLTDVWSESALRAEVDAMVAVLLPHAGSAIADPAQAAALVADAERLRDLIDVRKGQIEAALDAGDPPIGPPLPSVCYPAVGTFSATFSSPYGNFPFGGAPGTATVAVTLGAETLTFASANARVGASGTDDVTIMISARTAAGASWRLDLVLDRTRFVPATSALDWVLDSAQLYAPNADGVVTNFGEVGPGQVILDSAEPVTGATISGSVSGTITDTIR